MSLLMRRRALLSKFKKFLRTIKSAPPLYLAKCFDNNSLVNYKIEGNSKQDSMNSRNLPNGYTEIQYIESTGSQYIDTGVVPNQNTGFDIVFLTKNSISPDSTAYGCIMGARQTSNTQELQLTTYAAADSGNKGTLRFNNTNNNAGITSNTKMHITLMNKEYSNNNDTKYTIEAEDFTSPTTLTVFGLNNKATNQVIQNGKVQLFSLKLYDGDTLIRDFVPCYKDETKAAGLYDLVGNKFYAGSGSFTKGIFVPAPETPVDVDGVGELVTDETDINYGKYKIPIRASGNIFNYDKVNIYSYGNGGKFTRQDNGFTFNNPVTYSNYMTMNNSCLNLKPNTKYICRAIVSATNNGSTSGEGSAGSMARSLRLQTVAQTYDSKAIYIVQGYNLGALYEGEVITRFTTPPDLSSYKYITTRLADKISVTFKDIVIMEDAGQTIDEYEPYQEPIITNIYLDEPLYKAGTYADYIDFENQTVVKNIKKLEIKTTSPINVYNWTSKKGIFVYNVLDDSYHRSANALSNRNYNSWDEQKAATSGVGMWVGAGNTSFYWLGILTYLGLDTLDEFKTWLADNPTYVWYGSKHPITTPITLPKLPVFKGTTIYSIDGLVQPSNMEATYYSNER